MDNFCRACGKSIPDYLDDDPNYNITEKDKLCPACLIKWEKQVRRDHCGHVGCDEFQFTAFCLNEQMKKKDIVLQKVLDEKANLFMENLHLKEEIRQLLQGKGNEVLEGVKEKLEGLTKGYQELQERTMGLASYGGPKSQG